MSEVDQNTTPRRFIRNDGGNIIDVCHPETMVPSYMNYNIEPFAAIIQCTVDQAKIDKRTRSKWSRAVRYALAYKSYSVPLKKFIKRNGGINQCAARLRWRHQPKSR
jgi:hypothetical protein